MTDLLGQTIGQYQLVEIIHQGDRNVVYKGFQPDMNRDVAVKVLSTALAADHGFAQQFQSEMQLIAGLEHGNILPVYDFGQEENLFYIVTRFVEGGTLRDRLSQYYAPPGAQGMIHSIALTLDYVHGRGMIHGNLKPSNILIDQFGQPLLADMGVFQNIGFDPQHNVYASPEQARGESVDGRTDIYALGVLLYEMLIGEPPPIGAAPSPRLKRPDLPVDVEKVILKAMAQYPEQRFQTAGELSSALNMALIPQSAPTTQPAPVAPAPKPVPPPAPAPAPRRNTSWLVFLIGALAVICLLAVLAIFLAIGPFRDTGGDGGPTPVPTVTAAPGVEQPTLVPTVEQPTPVPTVEQPTQPPVEVVPTATPAG